MRPVPRVLVTGATGFVGAAVCRALGGDAEIHVASRSGTAPAGVVGHGVDLLDADDRLRLIERSAPDVVLHLAWVPIQPGVYGLDANHEFGDASVAFADACRSAGVERFAFAGSVVECGTVSGVITDDTTPQPDSEYGRAKQAASDGVLALASDGFHPVVPRIFFGYGPGEHRDRLVPAVIRSLLAGDRIALSAGTQIRDYAHVDDIASGFVAAAFHGPSARVNIGAGAGTAVRDLAQRIGELLDRADLLDVGERAAGADTADEWTADISTLRGLGWAPRFDLDSGLTDVIDHWRTIAAQEADR